MFRLRAEVEELVQANRRLLKALHEEVVGKPVEAGALESAFGPSDDASAETVEKDIEQLVHNTYGQDSL